MKEGANFALAAYGGTAYLTVNFSTELVKVAEKQEANPSLNIIQPPSGNVASCDKVHYADGPRIDASVLVLDANKAKKRAWDLNKQLFPRPDKYFDELDTFFHQGSCKDEAALTLDSTSSKLLSALLSFACFSRHGRSYIVDSGASHHLISFDALTPQEHKTVRKAKYTIPLQTANDVVHCKYEADVWVEDLQITVVAFVLETDVPPLLSVGKLNKVGLPSD